MTGGALSTSNAVLSIAPVSAVAGEFDVGIGGDDPDDVTAVGHRGRVPHEDLIGECRA